MEKQLAQQDYMRLLNLQSIHTFTIANHRNRLKQRLRASAQSFRKEQESLSAAASSCSASSSSTDIELPQNGLTVITKAGDPSSGSYNSNPVSITEESFPSIGDEPLKPSSDCLTLDDCQPAIKRPRLNGFHTESSSSRKHSLILRRNKEGEINPQDLKDWQRRLQILVRNSCRRAIEERNFFPPELRGQTRRRDYPNVGKSNQSECSSSSTSTVSDKTEPEKVQSDEKTEKSDSLATQEQTQPSSVTNVVEKQPDVCKSNQPKVIIWNFLQEPEVTETLRHQDVEPLTEEATTNCNGQEIVLNADDIFGLGLLNNDIGSIYSDDPPPKGSQKSQVFKRKKFSRYDKKGFNNGLIDRDSIEHDHEELLNLCVTEKQNLPRHHKLHLENRVKLGFHVEKLTVSDHAKNLITNGSLSPTNKENIHKEEKSKTKGVPNRQSIIQTRQGLKRQAKDFETIDISNHVEGIQIDSPLPVGNEESQVSMKSVAAASTQTPTVLDQTFERMKIDEAESIQSFETECCTVEANLSDEPFDSNSSCSKVKQMLETKCFRRNGRKVCYPDDLVPSQETFSIKTMIQPGLPKYTPEELRDRQLMNAVKVFTSPRHVPVMPDVLQLMTRFNNSCHAIVKNEPWHTAEIVRAINKYAQLVSGMVGQQQTIPITTKANQKVKATDKDLTGSISTSIGSSNGKPLENNDDIESKVDETSESLAPRQFLQRKAKHDAAIKEQQAKEKLQIRRPADPNLNLLMLAAETASMTSSSFSDLSRAASSTRDDCPSDHECEVVYRCQVCREEFVNVIDLSVHRYEKHRTCTKCKSGFNHVRKRSLVQLELCVPCFKSIPKVDDFEESNKCFQATFEILKKAQKSFEETEARHDCLLCTKKFESIPKMKKHLLSQHSDLLHTIDLNRLALLTAK